MNTSLMTLDHVTAAYGKKIIFKEACLSIHDHDFIIINGPNGGGKTTLMKMIAGLILPQHGSIKRQERLIIGYLPQYRGIDRAFPITVEETVLSGLNCRKSITAPFTKTHKDKVKELLETFQLADLGQRPINALSGGQWQRTLLARSLAGNPDLWLLDEPDTHLDAESQEYLSQRIAAEIGKRSIVIVTHNPQSLANIEGAHFWHVNHQHVQVFEHFPEAEMKEMHWHI